MKTSKAILGSILAIVSLVVASFISQSIIMLLKKCRIGYVVPILIGAILHAVIAYLLVKLIADRYLKVSLPRLGIPKFKISLKWILIAILLPLAVTAVFLVMNGKIVDANSSDMENIVFNIFYASLAAGFVEELIFRGVILNVLSIRWNYLVGVLIPSVIFGLLHIVSRNLSFMSIIQLIIAGTLVGVMFSLIEMSEHSIWNSAVVHAIWNLITSAIFAVAVSPQKDALYSYVISSKNALLTGGGFGMESSLIAIIGYLIVALIAYKIFAKNK